MIKRIIVATAILIATPALADDTPSKWTAMSVYSDGKVIISEGLSSKHICQESLCIEKDGMTCEDKADADAKAKEAARVAAEQRKKEEDAYLVDHPCKIEQQEGISVQNNKPATISYRVCELPNGGERAYHMDGSFAWESSGAQSGIMYGNWGNAAPSITHQVCFQ